MKRKHVLEKVSVTLVVRSGSSNLPTIKKLKSINVKLEKNGMLYFSLPCELVVNAGIDGNYICLTLDDVGTKQDIIEV